MTISTPWTPALMWTQIGHSLTEQKLTSTAHLSTEPLWDRTLFLNFICDFSTNAAQTHFSLFSYSYAVVFMLSTYLRMDIRNKQINKLQTSGCSQVKSGVDKYLHIIFLLQIFYSYKLFHQISWRNQDTSVMIIFAFTIIALTSNLRQNFIALNVSCVSPALADLSLLGHINP